MVQCFRFSILGWDSGHKLLYAHLVRINGTSPKLGTRQGVRPALLHNKHMKISIYVQLCIQLSKNGSLKRPKTRGLAHLCSSPHNPDES